MNDCGRGWQRIDGEREDRKVRIIKNIQKQSLRLCLTARKNPSISPGGFGFFWGWRVAGRGLMLRYFIKFQSSL